MPCNKPFTYNKVKYYSLIDGYNRIPGLKDCISKNEFLSKTNLFQVKSMKQIIKECLARPERTCFAFTYKGKKYSCVATLYEYAPGLKERITYSDFLDEITQPPKKSREDIEELIDRLLALLPVLDEKPQSSLLPQKTGSRIYARLTGDDPFMAYLKIIGPRPQKTEELAVKCYEPKPAPPKRGLEIELEALLSQKTISDFSTEEMDRLRALEIRIKNIKTAFRS